MLRCVGIAVVVLAAGALAPAGDQAKEKAAAPATFSLGLVQKHLRLGQSQADVVERLGSPNILTRDAEGREAWVYDRVATEVESSREGISVGGVGSGVGGTFAGLVGLGGEKRKEKARSSQRTLTVVIRFSASGAVESFSWHDSRF